MLATAAHKEVVDIDVGDLDLLIKHKFAHCFHNLFRRKEQMPVMLESRMEKVVDPTSDSFQRVASQSVNRCARNRTSLLVRLHSVDQDSNATSALQQDSETLESCELQSQGHS